MEIFRHAGDRDYRHTGKPKLIRDGKRSGGSVLGVVALYGRRTRWRPLKSVCSLYGAADLLGAVAVHDQRCDLRMTPAKVTTKEEATVYSHHSHEVTGL